MNPTDFEIVMLAIIFFAALPAVFKLIVFSVEANKHNTGTFDHWKL